MLEALAPYCWYPSSLHCQVISSQGINYVMCIYTLNDLQQRKFSESWHHLSFIKDSKCKYIFLSLENNSACNGLIWLSIHYIYMYVQCTQEYTCTFKFVIVKALIMHRQEFMGLITFNTLWPSDAIWWYRTGSTSAAPSHNLTQY